MNEGTINLFLVLVFVLCLAIIAYGMLTGNPLPYMILAVFLLILAFYFALTLKVLVSVVPERIEKMGG
jgi:1-acyl-sn-glycerol-3-phosphate acyltransferase